LAPVAEFVLGKRRILEIYLNVIEWGHGAMVLSRSVITTMESLPEYRPGTGGTARRDSASSAAATARAH